MYPHSQRNFPRPPIATLLRRAPHCLWAAEPGAAPLGGGPMASTKDEVVEAPGAYGASAALMRCQQVVRADGRGGSAFGAPWPDGVLLAAVASAAGGPEAKEISAIGEARGVGGRCACSQGVRAES